MSVTIHFVVAVKVVEVAKKAMISRWRVTPPPKTNKWLFVRKSISHTLARTERLTQAGGHHPDPTGFGFFFSIVQASLSPSPAAMRGMRQHLSIISHEQGHFDSDGRESKEATKRRLRNVLKKKRRRQRCREMIGKLILICEEIKDSKDVSEVK